MSSTLEVVVDDLSYVEGMRWHEGALWFSDMVAGRVVRVPPGGAPEVVTADVPMPSGLGWTASGRLLVVSLAANTVFTMEPSGTIAPLIEPGDHDGVHLNDMVTVGSRSYVSHPGKQYEPGDEHRVPHPGTGSIILVDHEPRAARQVATGMGLPNGMAVTADGRTLIVADSYARELVAFAITADGSLEDRRVHASLGEIPDAVAIDAEDGTWVGLPPGAVYRRIDRDGRATDEIAVPGWKTVVCALGGSDGRDLFLGVSQFDTADDLFAGRSRSRVLRARVAVPAC